MVEELKLAIKIDDASVEQSLLKQFANAQKMADKVVFTFSNINLADKNIEKQFKEMQKLAGKNPIELPINTEKAIKMLSSLGDEFAKILDITKGKSFIDSSIISSETNKATKSLENGFSNSINSVKGKFEELKSELTELENLYNKIGKGKYSKQYGKYVDNHSNNYVDLSGYGDVEKNKQSFDYLEGKLKEIYNLYNNVNTAIEKHNGWFNGVQYNSSDLNQMTLDFKSIAQAYYELNPSQMNKTFKEMSGALNTPVEKVKTLKQVTSKMSAEFKSYISEVMTDSNNVKANNKLFEEETQRLLKENEVTIKSYLELRDKILSKIPNQSDRLRISDYLPYINDVFPDFSNMVNFGTDEFTNKHIDVLKEICSILGIEIPNAAEKTEASLKNNSAILSQEKIQDELRKTETQAKETTQAVKEVTSVLTQESNISSASTESVTNSIKEENNVLEQNTQKVKENTQAKEQNANVNLNKYDKRLDSYNGKIDKYKTTIDRFNDGGWSSSTYLENVQAVKNAVHEYEILLNELKGKDASLVTSDDISKLDIYEKKIKDTIATVTNMSASEKGYNFVSGQKELDKIHKLLNENSKMSSEAKAKIKAYYAEIESGNPSMSLDKIHGEILKIYNAEVEAGRAGRTLWDTLKNSGFHQIAAQMAGMFGVYDVINLGKEGFNVVRELNTALTEMRKVSDETVQSLKDYQATTFDTADAVGTTAKQIQNSTADWMRLGESMNQAAESAKDANVLLNVSEFEGIDEATESLVSMSQAYKDLDKMDIIDVLNNIGNNYSISTDGLATALKDSASALVTANNDLNEAVSLTTAGNAITQDPSKVGAGLRTISLRLVGTEEAKQELSDLGEETDGMITTVSKLRDTIMDATKAASSDGKGFDILDSNGNYKSTYEIMQGLADLYDNIVKKDKELGTNNLNLLLETIAGKNRSNIAASILQNGDMLRSVYEDAQNSEGSAEKELNSYLDSIDGKMAQLENRAQEFWFKVIDSETIKNGIDLLSTLLKGATDFVDTVGLLPTILTGIGAALSFKNVG